MAPRLHPIVVFCILVMVCCCTVTTAQMALDCCLSARNKTIDKRVITDYRPQAAGCHIDATILVTRQGRNLCAPPNELWVEQVMKHVDHLKKKCKNTNYKGKRCYGVKRE